MGNNTWFTVSRFGEASRTTDDGVSWEPITITPTSTLREVDSDGNGVVIIVAENGFAFRSIDYGENFTLLPLGLNSGSSAADFYSVTTDRNGIWVAVAASGWAARSTDNGITWSSLTRGLNSGSLSAFFRGVGTDRVGNFVAVSAFGQASLSTDSGATWIGLPPGLNSGNASAGWNAVVGAFKWQLGCCSK